jgi:hypothetical protein
MDSPSPMVSVLALDRRIALIKRRCLQAGQGKADGYNAELTKLRV